MTSLAAVRKHLAPLVVEPSAGAPEGVITVAPSAAAEVADVLRMAGKYHLAVVAWGGGTHQGYGGAVEPAVVLSTRNLLGIDWQADDLTVTVGAGVTVADLESRLGEGGQMAVLPEQPGAATVGGVIAAGVSGYRRLRYGPIRDRVLGMTLITGDGRVVKGRGKVVKNVAGYDLPRLLTGSLGRLGVITEITLKLWPVPASIASTYVDRPEEGHWYRPLAMLERNGHGTVVLGGHPDAIRADAPIHTPGAAWPEPIADAVRLEVRVPARYTRAAIDRAPDGWSYLAQFGVGAITVGTDAPHVDAVLELRRWAESTGGSLVIAAGDLPIDPWGTPPPSLDIQRRIVEAFDPQGIMAPGRLPGGL
ncbi:MAG: FAD-binding protein [Acidimicrobiia bacterium]